MISSYKIIPQQQTKQRQLNTCHLNRVNSNNTRNISSTLDSNTLIAKNYTLLESKNSKMTTLAADLSKAAVAAATANAKTMGKPPMEAVVVNSIIYSKPSFCTIAVDLGSTPRTGDNKSATAKPNTGNCSNSSIFHNEMDLNSSCWPNLSVPPPSADAKVYRMSTTINGSIHHHISELWDNILATAEFFSAADNDHDDDSLIEFAYKDDDNLVFGEDIDNDDDEDDDEDEDDYPDDEDEDDYENDGNLFDDDDDNDVVDFSYECPIEPAPKLNCDKKKKVRFNTKPTVHVMHTWSYAYRAARKGEWEMYARDRERFKLRIQRAAFTLNPILEREHRQKIYEKRFVNLSDNENHNAQFKCQQTDNLAEKAAAKTEDPTENSMGNNETSRNESKKPHQKKKRRKRRYCKMGNKHYF
ncbi:hypothetical protein DOY81_000268 [Sarcophaga bullata]|nr:hypothetical protein DOY81_000268 [Sarcophaga bullata]